MYCVTKAVQMGTSFSGPRRGVASKRTTPESVSRYTRRWYRSGGSEISLLQVSWYLCERLGGLPAELDPLFGFGVEHILEALSHTDLIVVLHSNSSIIE